MTTNNTTKKNSVKIVTLSYDELPEVFATRNEEWFATKRAEIEALEQYAIELRKDFDRLVEQAKGAGFAQDIVKITKPRGRKSAADNSDPFAWMKKK